MRWQWRIDEVLSEAWNSRRQNYGGIYREIRQGQRSLTRFSDEHLGQVLVVPAAAAAFHDEAVSAWMLFQ
jgi:hypothetical protein